MTVAGSEGRLRAERLGTMIAFFIIFQQVLGKAVRDAFFLSHYEATQLPLVMTVTSVVGVLVVLALSRALVRWGPGRVAPLLFALHSFFFLVEWALSSSYPASAAFVTYLHTGALGGASVSAFWSLLNEQFDPRSAKRSFGRIGAGAAAGGFVGGAATWWFSSFVEIPNLLLGTTLLALVSALGLGLLGTGPGRRPEKPTAPSAGALATMRSTPFLWLLLGVVALVSLTDVLIEFLFKARAAAQFTESADLLSFFSLFYMTTGVVTFVVQIALTPRMLGQLGLSPTASALPLLTLLASFGSLVVSGLAPTLVLRGATTVAENSLYRSAYELAYTPIAQEKKRATKTFIDVGGGRIASACGGLLTVLLVSHLATESLFVAITWLSIFAAAFSALLIYRLRKGYTSSLAEGLQSGAIELDEEAIEEATNRATLANTVALDRNKLLAAIESRRSASLESFDGQAAKQAEGEVRGEEWAKQSLNSLNVVRITQVWQHYEVLPAGLVPHVLPLLGRESLRREAARALRRSESEATSELLRALQDSSIPVRVRQHLPRVLQGRSGQVVADGLVTALRDPVFEIRLRSAVALVRLRETDAELTLDEARVMERVGEVGLLSAEVWASVGSLESDEDLELLVDQSSPSNGGRGLAYLFSLLLLVSERRPLELAFAAIASNNPHLRGTGLEYLEQLIPQEIFGKLRPTLENRDLARRSTRPRQEIVQELERSSDSLVLPRSQLKSDQS